MAPAGGSTGPGVKIFPIEPRTRPPRLELVYEASTALI